MPKLTDTQLVILSAAAQREGGAILPLPKTLKLNRGTAGGVLKSLLKKSLVAERPAARDEEAWRDDGEAKHIALVITDAGLKAIGIEPEAERKGAPASSDAGSRKSKMKHTNKRDGGRLKPEAERTSVRPGTKMALLIDLLGCKSGVTIDEIAKATGWQAHSVRGAISGALKKKLGIAVSSEKAEGRARVYRITAHR